MSTEPEPTEKTDPDIATEPEADGGGVGAGGGEAGADEVSEVSETDGGGPAAGGNPEGANEVSETDSGEPAVGGDAEGADGDSADGADKAKLSEAEAELAAQRVERERIARRKAEKQGPVESGGKLSGKAADLLAAVRAVESGAKPVATVFSEPDAPRRPAQEPGRARPVSAAAGVGGGDALGSAGAGGAPGGAGSPGGAGVVGAAAVAGPGSVGGPSAGAVETVRGVLAEGGAPEALASQVAAVLGEGAADELRADPWQLLRVTGVRPEQADGFARALLGAKCAPDDERRGRAVTVWLLEQAALAGHTVLELPALVTALGRQSVPDADAAVQSTIAEAEALVFQDALDPTAPVTEGDDEEETERPVRILVGLERYALAEESLADGLARLINSVPKEDGSAEDWERAAESAKGSAAELIRAVSSHGLVLHTGGEASLAEPAALLEAARSLGLRAWAATHSPLGRDRFRGLLGTDRQSTPGAGEQGGSGTHGPADEQHSGSGTHRPADEQSGSGTHGLAGERNRTGEHGRTGEPHRPQEHGRTGEHGEPGEHRQTREHSEPGEHRQTREHGEPGEHRQTREHGEPGGHGEPGSAASAVSGPHGSPAAHATAPDQPTHAARSPHPVATVAGLLSGVEGPGRDADGAFDLDLLVVLDAPQLDVETAALLVESLPDGARLVLGGDPAVLWSAGPGRVFADLLAARICPQVASRRPDPGPLGELVSGIGIGELNQVEAPGKEIVIVPVRDAGEAVHRTVQLVADSVPRAIGVPAEETQVITPGHGGAAGTRALNAALKERLNPGPGRFGGFDPGDRVAYSPAPGRTLAGHVVKADAEGLHLTCAGEPVVVPKERVEQSVRHGWALTAHQAAGGRWPAVVAVLPGDAAQSLTRPWVYTAFGRAARHLSVVHGADQALARAVAEIPAKPRTTRLPILLLSTPTAG